MSVGRITKSKLTDYIKLKKYKNCTIPIRNKDKWNYKCIDFITKEEFIYESNILSVFSEYCKDNLIFYYSYGNLNTISHDHSFDSVLQTLYEYPETFSIPKEYKKYYSKRELEFLESLQKKLLNDNLKDIGIFYEEHPLKKEYESKYLEYNIEELRKRNIKK